MLLTRLEDVHILYKILLLQDLPYNKASEEIRGGREGVCVWCKVHYMQNVNCVTLNYILMKLYKGPLCLVNQASPPCAFMPAGVYGTC